MSGYWSSVTPKYFDRPPTLISNSIHLIIDGAVHSDPLFLSSPQIKDVMLEFMKGQKPSTTQITLEPLKFAPLNPQKAN